MVATRARSGAMRYTAASSRAVPTPCSTLGSTIGGSAPSTCPSSTGLSLQAQPAPWLYSVNRIGGTWFIGAKYPRPSPPSSPLGGEGALLADRRQLQPSLDGRLARGVVGQVGGLLLDPLCLRVDLAQHLRLAQGRPRPTRQPIL